MDDSGVTVAADGNRDDVHVCKRARAVFFLATDTNFFKAVYELNIG